MAHVADHLSVAALEARYEACGDVTSSRHFQTIWLLAKGHTVGQVAAMTSFGQRWIEQLLERYNAFGPPALGDLRRGNGAAATVLKPEVLERLRVRLADPPPGGGVWTSGKVAHWMAGELGLASLAPQRGWEALRAIDWSIQKPRPRNPKAATPEEQDIFKKGSYSVSCWYGPFPMALLIQFCGVVWSAQASSARRQPRSFGRFLVATPLKRLSHCLRRLW